MPDRESFARLSEDLIARVETDLDSPEWVTKRYVKRMRDADRTVFEVAFLVLQKGPVRLSLDPTGYDIPGAEAAVDLYLMPTYDPLATFYSEDGDWFIHSDYLPKGGGEQTESEQPLIEEGRAPFSHATLNQVMEAIADNAIPSI